MNRLTVSLVALSLVLIVASLAIADELYQIAGDPQNIKVKIPNNVSFSNTIYNFTIMSGMSIGGNPATYALLAETVTLHTSVGDIVFTNGTKIDCDVPPGYPDPCDPY